MRQEKSNPERRSTEVSDAERDQVMRRLATAVGEGRLSIEDLEDRLNRRHQARTREELNHLIADVADTGPPAQRPGASPDLETEDPQEAERAYVRSHLLDAERDGQWYVPREVIASAGRGSVELDFTHAILSHNTVTVDARPNVGNVVLVVPDNYVVTTEENEVGANAEVNDRRRTRSGESGATSPDAPRLRILASGGLGSIIVRNPHRGPLSFLRRDKSAPSAA